MKKIKFWQFVVIIATGFSVGVIGANWYMSKPPEDDQSSLPVGIAEADFRLPEFEGDIFTPQKAVYDGDDLVLTLNSNVLHPEPLEEVRLSNGAEHGTVNFRYTADGNFNVIVTNPPSDLDNATLDLPAISIEYLASISVDPNAETFIGPRDATYKFTYRGSNDDSLRIEYKPDVPSSPSISHAKIQAEDVEIHTIQSGGKFDSMNRFIFGRLVFPIEAQKLMQRDDAELVITQYSEIVRDSVAMPVGIVSEDIKTNNAPRGPGFESESPIGPIGNTGDRDK